MQTLQGSFIFLSFSLMVFLNQGCTVSTSLLGEKASSSNALIPLPEGAEFTVQFGTAGGMIVGGLAGMDSSGALYYAGVATGSIGTSALIGTQDTVTVKYSKDGQLEWIAREGDSGGGTVVSSRARFKNNHVYVVGMTNAGFNGQAGSGGATDAYIVKYDTDGNREWTRLLGDASGSTVGIDVFIDANDNLFVIGYTGASLAGNTLGSNVDSYIAKYDKDGNLLWVKQIGGGSTSITNAEGLAVDNAGNIYMTGVFMGTFDGHSSLGVDAFVAKFDSSGNIVWSRTYSSGTSQTTAALGIALDATGNIFITGYATGNLDGNTLIGIMDQYLVKYDSAGNKLWTKTFGIAGKMLGAYAVTVDNNGFVYFAGGDSLGSNGSTGWTLHKHDATTGAQVTLYQGGSGAGDCTITDFVIDSNGYLNAGGTTAVGLDGQTQIGNYDGFVLRKKLN